MIKSNSKSASYGELTFEDATFDNVIAYTILC